MSDPTYPAYPFLALTAAVLVIVPLPWHLQAWNAGTCLYMIWTSIACLNLGINSIIWRATAIDYAPVWCDISSRIIVASAVAIPAASLCIVRRLYKIASMQTVSISRAQRRNAVLVDLSIGVGIPLLQLVMQYIVSGHRYDIFAEIGCYPFTYNTPPAYPLSITWPIIIGLISAVYCILTLRAFLKRRAALTEMFSSNGSITAQRYLRLMALATMEILCTIPIATYGTYLNLTLYEVQPWISWSDTHFNYSHVNLYPSILWRMDRIGTVSLELSRSLPVFCALIFFCFFGFADEARRNYRKAYFAVISLFKPVRGFRIFRFRSQESTLPFDNSLPSTSPTSSSWSIPKCREFSLSPKAEHFPFSRDRGVSKSNFSPTSSCFA